MVFGIANACHILTLLSDAQNPNYEPPSLSTTFLHRFPHSLSSPYLPPPIPSPHSFPPPSSGAKSPSPAPPIYEPWGADIFHTSKKIPHIAAHVDLPGPLLLSPRVYSPPTAVSASSNESLTGGASVRDRLPPVLIVNLQVRRGVAEVCDSALKCVTPDLQCSVYLRV